MVWSSKIQVGSRNLPILETYKVIPTLIDIKVWETTHDKRTFNLEFLTVVKYKPMKQLILKAVDYSCPFIPINVW